MGSGGRGDVENCREHGMSSKSPGRTIATVVDEGVDRRPHVPDFRLFLFRPDIVGALSLL